jgi:hypothetical protein
MKVSLLRPIGTGCLAPNQLILLHFKISSEFLDQKVMPYVGIRYGIPMSQRTFKEFGLPQAIRTDSGVPFASPNALFGLS